MIVLEREDRARARGAHVYAAVEGYASTCDAYHRVQMDPDGAEIVACIEGALERPGRAPEEIGYVNYHGTSTVLNDAIESRCVRRVFGPTGRTGAGIVDQVDDRPSAGRQRRRRRRHDGAGALARVHPADGQPHGSRSRVRHGLHPAARAGRRSPLRRSATAWASARRTARSCWGTREPRRAAHRGACARLVERDVRDDVLIAGAGPAGSIAALLLARAGLRVRLLDRATFPRDKLCGDTLNPGALDILRRLGIGGRHRTCGPPDSRHGRHRCGRRARAAESTVLACAACHCCAATSIGCSCSTPSRPGPRSSPACSCRSHSSTRLQAGSAGHWTEGCDVHGAKCTTCRRP